MAKIERLRQPGPVKLNPEQSMCVITYWVDQSNWAGVEIVALPEGGVMIKPVSHGAAPLSFEETCSGED